MRPKAEIKNAIDFSQSVTARTIFNLEKIGVIFESKKPFFTKLVHGHISMKFDGIIKQGFPDFPSERGLLFVKTHSKASMSEARESKEVSYLEKSAHLLMAYGGFKKSAIIHVCPDSGSIFAQVVELNLNLANIIFMKSSEGVVSDSAPQRIKGNQEKCDSCPFSIYCIAPETPSPTCRNCVNFIIGDNGFAGCSAKSGKKLSVDEQMNLDKCNMHIYKPCFLDSWAEEITDETDAKEGIGFRYYNRLNGGQFLNSNDSGDGVYSSYELFAVQGKTLIADKNIDKIKSMFGAQIMDE